MQRTWRFVRFSWWCVVCFFIVVEKNFFSIFGTTTFHFDNDFCGTSTSRLDLHANMGLWKKNFPIFLVQRFFVRQLLKFVNIMVNVSICRCCNCYYCHNPNQKYNLLSLWRVYLILNKVQLQLQRTWRFVRFSWWCVFLL